MNLSRILFFFISLSFAFSASVHSQVILVDPGHGGEDCGAKKFIKKGKDSQKICEKDLALEIAKAIQNKLKTKYRVYLTRSFDRNLTLHQRAEMADKVKADLFISVHANSSRYRKSNGFETYYLSNHKDKAISKIESVENTDVSGTQVIINKILADLVIDRSAPQSKSLASHIHRNIKKNLKKKYKIRNRGIKPAIFYVLVLSKRPAVLLEPGFISNAKDYKRLFSKEFQDAYAQSVLEGVNDYFKDKRKF